MKYCWNKNSQFREIGIEFNINTSLHYKYNLRTMNFQFDTCLIYHRFEPFKTDCNF